MALFIFILGLIIGSFLGALTYRLPREISIVKGRSFCPNCRTKISWYDNIPLMSFILLKGRCRNCHKKISLREPLIELGTGLMFLLIYYQKILPVFDINGSVYFLFVTAVMLAIFITDLESQIIPDTFSLFLVILASIEVIFTNNDNFYGLFLSGFSAGLFLLLLNLITKGKGMGLGDVKLAIFGGIFFGFPKVITWLFLSFVIGAAAGLMLVIMRRTKFGRRIAFAPFLVFSFFLVFLWGDAITAIILPYL